MSTTFSIRIPRELKEKIEKNPADWSQEVREFLAERIKQIELTKTLQEIEPRAEKEKQKSTPPPSSGKIENAKTDFFEKIALSTLPPKTLHHSKHNNQLKTTKTTYLNEKSFE